MQSRKNIINKRKQLKQVANELFKQVIHSRKYLETFYNYFNIFLTIMGEHNIPYFAYGGTMLGCIRHNGVIPWDDDIDIMVEEKYEQLMKSDEYLNKLKKYGIHLNMHSVEAYNGWLQFYLENPKLSTEYKYGHSIPIDVFIAIDDPNKKGALNYKSDYYYKGFSKRYMMKNEIYPLQTYKFGPLKILGMNNPHPYFKRCNFGDYMNRAIVILHKYKSEKQKKDVIRKKRILKRDGEYPLKDKNIVKYKFPYYLKIRDINEYLIE